ncbi:MAG: hypothetical protein WC460_01895 [Patescibacteria group bacterium]
MPVGQDTRGRIHYFIKEHGDDNPVLRIPVGSVKPKQLPRKVRELIKTTVQDAGWQVWKFKHEKCEQTMGITTFVIIRKPAEATPTTRDN